MEADLSNLAYTASATSAVALVCFAAMLRDGEGVRVVHERRVLQVECVARVKCVARVMQILANPNRMTPQIGGRRVTTT